MTWALPVHDRAAAPFGGPWALDEALQRMQEFLQL